MTAAYIIEVHSRSGKPINKLTGSPWQSFGVYSQTELKQHLARLKQNPDLRVTWRKPK